jgi:nucleotide-binding universal stress UspA family protein
MICLAYDGSLNGDWVARYAIRFAAGSGERVLQLFHVLDGSLTAADLDAKLEHLRRECGAQGVELFPELLPLGNGTLSTLLHALPADPDAVVVCGTRVRGAGRPLLAGTVAERLLALSPWPVLALRVVQPGLLGAPHDLLLPLAGHPRGFAPAWPVFRLFLPQLKSVHLLRGMVVSRRRLGRFAPAEVQAIRQQGVRYLAEISEEIRKLRGSHDFFLDSRIVVSDDWVAEILVHASRLKSQVLLLGASQRSRLSRLSRLWEGDPLERVLRRTPCDVGIYRG